jgi:hypothetical protein
MPNVSPKLTDPSGNVSFIYDFSLNKALNDSLTNEQLYGISEESYKIIYDNSMTYIGYGVSMSLFNAQGDITYLTGINNKTNIESINR